MAKRSAVRNLTRPNELRTSLAASGVVGTWEWDLVNRCIYYDADAADLLIGDRSLAGRPIDGMTGLTNVHPDDREWMMRDLIKAVECGSLFLVEYRVVKPDRSVRWLLCRGRIYRAEDGRAVRGRGIIIDITESREAGDAAEGYVAQPSAHEETAIIQAADRCLEARAALEQHGAVHLLRKMDELLLAVGLELARSEVEEPALRLH